MNCSGYQLSDLRSTDRGEGQVNLAKLLVGSEGTLALVTEATLKTLPLPQHTSSLLLYFNSLDKAAHATLELIKTVSQFLRSDGSTTLEHCAGRVIRGMSF